MPPTAHHAPLPSRLLQLAALALAVLALAATTWILVTELSEEETMAGPGLQVMPADLGGPFTLVDHHGEPVTEAVFQGRITFLYFGYSFCPDICPMSLQTMASAMEAAGEDDNDVAGAFVTVDPARDTVDHLATYVSLFHDRLVGLTGGVEAIDQTVKSFRAYYKLRTDVDPKNYPVDHSSYIYLLDRDWRLAAVFRHDATVEEMTAAIRRLL